MQAAAEKSKRRPALEPWPESENTDERMCANFFTGKLTTLTSVAQRGPWNSKVITWGHDEIWVPNWESQKVRSGRFGLNNVTVAMTSGKPSAYSSHTSPPCTMCQPIWPERTSQYGSAKTTTTGLSGRHGQSVSRSAGCAWTLYGHKN